MRNYLCKWPNGDVVLISARDKQQVREILDEQADPGRCQIVRMKGAFAIEFIPKVPKRPRDESAFHRSMFGADNEDYEAPEDPAQRPQVMRWIGPSGTTVDADLFQEYGGKLTAAEAAAVQRWKQAIQQQQQGGAAVAAAAEEPWVTEQQLQDTGMLDEPYYVQVEHSHTEYGRYTSRLMKRITEHFFPKTHAALKPVASSDRGEKANRSAAIRNLRAAIAADVWDKTQDEEADRKRAKLIADACNGDRNAILQFVTDQTTNVYGHEATDDDDTSSYEYDSGDSDGYTGVLSMVRHAQVQGIADVLGMGGGAGRRSLRARRGAAATAARDQRNDSDGDEEEDLEDEDERDEDDDDGLGAGGRPKRGAWKAGRQPTKKQRGGAAAAAASPVSRGGRGCKRKP